MLSVGCSVVLPLSVRTAAPAIAPGHGERRGRLPVAEGWSARGPAGCGVPLSVESHMCRSGAPGRSAGCRKGGAARPGRRRRRSREKSGDTGLDLHTSRLLLRNVSGSGIQARSRSGTATQSRYYQNSPGWTPRALSPPCPVREIPGLTGSARSVKISTERGDRVPPSRAVVSGRGRGLALVPVRGSGTRQQFFEVQGGAGEHHGGGERHPAVSASWRGTLALSEPLR